MLLYGFNQLQEKIRLGIPNPPDPMKAGAVKDLGSENEAVRR
jgi:NADH-quinone oxidoreductase subunit B